MDRSGEVVRGPGPLDWSTDRGSVFSGHPGFSYGMCQLPNQMSLICYFRN